jgi:hypothetical protein
MFKLLACVTIILLAVNFNGGEPSKMDAETYKAEQENQHYKSKVNFDEIEDEFIKENFGFLEAYMKVDNIVEKLGKPKLDDGFGTEQYIYTYSKEDRNYSLSLDVTNGYLNYATIKIFFSDNTVQTLILIEPDPNLAPQPFSFTDNAKE